MTRYTNVGRKRTYVQASFDPGDDQITSNLASTSALNSLDTSRTTHESSIDAAPEPSRKRSRKSKDHSGEKQTAESVSAVVISAGDKKNPPVTKSERAKKALAKLKAKEKAKRAKNRAASTEARRLKRLAGRRAQTTCFACREVGHAAQDCPSIRPGADHDWGGGTTGTTTTQTVAAVVGICYRCGSRKHNLARCRQPAQPDNPLPFASCFVCSGHGHLASSCPQNSGKGVYPNGGSCKLCGETTHLARDCTLRKNEVNARATVLGTGREAGADEDDFHTIRRKNTEMDRDEHGEARARKEAKVRSGALTGVVKAFGKVPVKPKNMVYF